MNIKLSTDSDGFISQECPSCQRQFKIKPGHGSPEPIAFCPYCRHHGKDCWWTTQQANYLSVVAANHVVNDQVRSLTKSLGKGIRLDVKAPRTPPLPDEPENDFPFAEFGCCGETIKHDAADAQVFCVICGTERAIPMTDPMRIFLSHKGCDKPSVRRFAESLTKLGFSPWLDEDALHAGTELERALLQGFKDSCAAVFFVTPSFRDEKFLATEVNYAIHQKREKGERFAIIALALKDDGGRCGTIPELLRSYVWKEPNTELEGLVEILKALPISVGPVHWKGEAATVVNREPGLSSRNPKSLSADASSLLMEAVQDNEGRVLVYQTMDGFHVQTNGKELNAQNSARSEAIWRSAVKELTGYRLLEGIGAKGEMFAVTKEGYERAEELRIQGRDQHDQAVFALTDEERTYLLAISRPRNQQGISTYMFDEYPTRENAKYSAMLEKFANHRLMRLGGSGYVMTPFGYEVTDRLWGVLLVRSIQQVQSHEQSYVSTEELAVATQLTDGAVEKAVLVNLLAEQAKAGNLELVPCDGGTAAARITPNGVAFLRNYAEIGIVPKE